MKKFLFSLVFALPILGFSQLFKFDTTDEGWTKSGSGSSVFGANGIGQVVWDPNSLTSNFLDMVAPLSSVNATNNKFVRVRLKNTVAESVNVRVRIGNTAVGTAITMSTPDADYVDYIFNFSAQASWTGSAIQPSIRFTKSSGSGTAWAAGTILVDEIEFGNDFYKSDYLFTYSLEGWAAINTGGNNSSVALSSGKMIVTPAGAANARVENASYSIDGTNNKYIHVIYKNNSTNNNRLRANFFHSGDNYASQVSISTEELLVNGNAGEVIFDATSKPEWSGAIRRLFFIITSNDGTSENSANVDTGTLEIDQIVINNSSSTLSTGDINKAKTLVQVYVAENKLNFRNANVTKATVFSMNGQVVKETKVANNNIDISSLKSGVFIVKTTAQDGSETITKFVKK